MTAAPPPAPVREAAPAHSNGDGRSALPASDLPIVVEGVTVRFGDLDAIRDISLRVPRGTILGVIGPSGAGKTTTVRVLTGALEPTKGKAVVLDEDPRRFHRRTRERIGYMPQQFTLYPDLTAGENVDFVASLFGLLWFRRRRRVKEVLHLVDLWDARGRRAADLSGGMQRRLELASALVHDPELLFLDEPTAGIDPLLRGRIWDELHRLKSRGRTLIVTTQYVTEAEECDAVALIAQGRLLALATPDDLRRLATGGDIIEIETAKAFDAQGLVGTPLVQRVHQMTPRSIRVVVEDAGSATPTIVNSLNAAGADVLSAREYRLTFDEVFAELVARGEQQAAVEERAEAAHEQNEDEARQMVEHELERRREDGRTEPLDEQAEAAERTEAARLAGVRPTDGTDGGANTAPDAAARMSQASARDLTATAPYEPARRTDGPRTMDDQARNLPPDDDLDGVGPGSGAVDAVLPDDPDVRMDEAAGLRPPRATDEPGAGR